MFDPTHLISTARLMTKILYLSEYQFKWEVFPLMGVYILIGVFAIPLMRGVIITYE